jgi:hypothetical protein
LGNTTYYKTPEAYYTQFVQDGRLGYALAEYPTEFAETPEFGEDAAAPEGFDGFEPPNPYDVLQRMSAYFGGLNQFRITSKDTMDQILDDEQRIQNSAVRTVTIRRPNKAYAEIRGDDADRRVWYDGATLTVYDVKQNLYSSISAPPTLDQALGVIEGELGVRLPLADLLYTSPFQALTEKTEMGQFLGTEWVGADLCQHLVFRGPAVDWDAWIDDGSRPAPKKLSIVYKGRPSPLRCAVTITEWQEAPAIETAMFSFSPPAGAARVSTLPKGAVGPGGQRPAKVIGSNPPCGAGPTPLSSTWETTEPWEDGFGVPRIRGANAAARDHEAARSR